MVKGLSLTSEGTPSAASEMRTRAFVVAGPVTVHGSLSSFGVLANSVSKVAPPSRESSIWTLVIDVMVFGGVHVFIVGLEEG
jgi:hypothetical protein